MEIWPLVEDERHRLPHGRGSEFPVLSRDREGVGALSIFQSWTAAILAGGNEGDDAFQNARRVESRSMHPRTVLLFTLLLATVCRAQVITTVAGSSSGTSGSDGDGGSATNALLQQPTGVALDGAGNIYIADYFNQRIRKVDTSGVISTIAGDGTAGDTGDGGTATAAHVNYPWAIAVDGGGNVYFTERLGHRVRKIDKSGNITTVAGNGTTVSSLNGTDLGDGGPAKNASLYSPFGLAVDSAGNLYIGDTQHDRVRKVDTAGVHHHGRRQRNVQHGYGWNRRYKRLAVFALWRCAGWRREPLRGQRQPDPESE